MTSAMTTLSSLAMAQDNSLTKVLAQVLPKDSRFTAWHLSTTPATTDALCFPPAVNSTTEKRPSKPLQTYCEKHFLALSVPDPATSQDVLVLALEVYIYTTAFSTTIFVSKADSTGYLHLQSTPQGFSPIQAVIVAFLDFLVEHRRRPSKQLIVNLFARAQAQYLFPGSMKNEKKHVLDDRGLIKWWCKVLNSLLEHNRQDESTRNWDRAHGYLVVPGLDNHETRLFVPRTEGALQNWTFGDPLELVSPYKQDPISYGNVPLRCLIPTYPDDPKARFVEELEDTTSEKAKLLVGWKVPATLDQFWEMMSFRQECSSGRMTGFFWLVYEPPKDPTASQEAQSTVTSPNATGTPSQKNRPSSSSFCFSAGTKSLRVKKRAKKQRKGPIITRKPQAKTHHARKLDRIVTPYYYWPEMGRGKVVLSETSYTRAVDLLLNLEFKGLEKAVASTARWVSEVNMGEGWALPIIGEKVMPVKPAAGAPGLVNNLAGSIIRKRKSGEEPAKDNTPNQVNMLGGGLIRKKAKADAEDKPAEADAAAANTTASAPTVNVLGSGLVRKKSKAQ